MTGQALRMTCQLNDLARQHGVPRITGYSCEQLLPETGDRPCILNGYATTFGVDHERMRIAPHSLRWSPKLPPLYWRHDAAATVGSVDVLEWDTRGLRISATTDHPLAMRAPAFSLGVTVHDYVIRSADGPNFHAEVTKGFIDEVSLTPVPAHPGALVVARRPQGAHVRYFDLGVRAFTLVQQIIRQMAAQEN